MEEIQEITIKDVLYPALLKKIPNPPQKIYFKGKLKKDDLCFAIVGTRLCSDYGRQAALEFAGNLSQAGLTVVSGLAPGIDTLCHKAALEKGGKTIAVLGTGLDEKSVYPKENVFLAQKILESGGCLISEYPEGTRAAKFTFPQRNRIISGMSLGVLVIEAKEKSGSLITADFAFRQKRKVFAVPGPIYSLNSRGSNELIRKGAKLARDYRDVLKELGLSGSDKKFFSGKTGLPPEENAILLALSGGSLYIDEIVEKTRLGAKTVAASLTILEMEGRVRNLGGNVYSLRSN